MRDSVRAIVASVLLLCVMTTIAAIAAGTSLVLGWAENHPQVTDVAAWVLGGAVVVFGLYITAHVWLAIFRRLDRDQ